MNMQISDIISNILENYGVKRAYGMIGYGVDVLMQSLEKTNIRIVNVLNEECAGFASGADAYFSDAPTVCLGSTGPGVVNILNGLYDAHRNNNPVLFIAFQVKSKYIGMNQGNEVDIKRVFSECSHYCDYVYDESQIASKLELALQTALIKRGVSVIIIPQDMPAKTIDVSSIPKASYISKPRIYPSENELKKIAAEINKSQKTVIFGGYGCKGANEEVMNFARKIKAPVGWAYRGKAYLDHNNTYPIGMNGLLGDKSCLDAFHNCDLLLLLGTGFAFTNFYPEHCRIIQIDIDGSNINRRHWVDIGVVGDVKDTIVELDKYVNEKHYDSFAKIYTSEYSQVLKHLTSIAEEKNGADGQILPEHLASEINCRISKDALVVSDIGSPWAYMAKYIDTLGTRDLYHSNHQGTMANALSSAIGMQIAQPDRQVVAMCGDGGFTMLAGDIQTIVKEKLPIKIFVFNNKRLDFVALEMKVSGLIDAATDLKETNFAKLAEAVGMKGYRVEKNGDLESVMTEALAYDGPVVVDVSVNPNSLLMPPSINIGMMRGFTEYIWKAFISGEKKTVLEMFKTNFPRQI